MKTPCMLILAGVLCAATSGTAAQNIVNFECLPGVGAPTEGASIGDQFASTLGIRFRLEDGSEPVIAEVGLPKTAFEPNDTPLPGQGIGQFFLTDDGITTGGPIQPLIVSYDVPTAEAGGVILDLDFNEQFVIQARDVNDAVLETITLVAGDPGTGNALATPWTFQRASADVFSVKFFPDFSGASFFGLGFDNFSARTAAADDGDGIAADQDNCATVANASQLDTDGDGIGNACDADLNNDCVINVVDLGMLRSVFFSSDIHADFNGDGIVNVQDLGIMRSIFFCAPGPSGVTNSCGTP